MLSLTFSSRCIIRRILLTFFISLFSSSSQGNTPCIEKSYGEGRFVCVCNATYCDDLPPATLGPKGGLLIYTSNQEGARLQTSTASFQSFGRIAESLDEERTIPGQQLPKKATIQVSRQKMKQKVVGYGGAFTDATGINLQELPPGAQEKLIEAYFGPNGIGYSLGRVPMGGCDFSPRNYTYADTPGDSTLATFSLQPEDHLYKIPYIKMAMSMSPHKIRLYGSPWSAPPWMKTNNDYIGRGFLRREFYQTWADYFVKFLESYDAVGLRFWGVTTQNEPFDGLVPHFPFNCMGWYANQQRDWIKNNLGPTLKRSQFPDLKVIILDENTAALPHYPQEILEDAEAAQYIWGIGLHWYSTDMTTHEPIQRTHLMFPEAAIIGTEACAGFLPWQREKVILGSWERGEDYAEDILKGLRNHVLGWTDWNLALNTEGGPNWAKLAADSAIIVNKTSGEFYKQPMFYALAHVAKFFVPESEVLTVEVTSEVAGGEAAQVTAAAVQRPDGSIALVMLNRYDEPLEVSLVDAELGEYRTVLPKRSLQTYVYATV